MTHRTLWGVVAALFLAATAGAAPPDTAPPTGPKAGSITALLPVAHIVRGPAKQEVTAIAKKGDEVVWNDLVRTDKGGRARITLLDQSILSVGSQAELRIIKSDAKSQQTSIEVGYGRVRMEVTPITKQGGSFEVKTPTAVAGVIGTVFGIDSAIGVTTFLCISDTLMVGSNDPNVPGRVPCVPGMAAVVATGKPAVTRPLTQQEIQKLIQDTEPAMISAMNPSSLLPGTAADVTITGTQLGNVKAVSSSSPSVTATLNAGGTATSVSVHLVVAARATPGPVTLTLSKPSGVSSAAVFSILTPQTAAAAGEAPSIKGLSTTTSPSTGGVPVTITGTNFDPNTKVMFGNVASSSVTFVSSTQLTVIVPPENPGTVDILVVTGTGQTTTLAGGFSFGGPVAAISPQDKSVNPGEQVTLDGSRSSDTLAGTTLTYSWTLCSLGFKPPQVGASLPPMNAPACNPATGTVAGTDSQFSLSAPAAYGQYFARLQVTDNLGASAVIYSSVTVSQPTYDDPVTRMNSLAQAFSTLQSSLVLGYFDPSYTGLTSLQQSLQTVFPTYSSMTVNLLSVTPNVSGTTAIITANWQLKYTLKGSSTISSSTPEAVTTVWTLTPGKGWFVTEFRLPNGFTPGALPAVPVTTTSQPSIIISCLPGSTSCPNPVQLNGALPEALVLTAMRSDNITDGSVTLTFTGSQVASTPPQFTIAYGTPQPVDFEASIVGGDVTQGLANVTVRPSNAAPAAGPQTTTLFFNIGDINLSGAPSCLRLVGGQTPALTFTIDAVSGFNISTVNWQWSGFPAGVALSPASPASGTATLGNTLPDFTFTSSITGAQTFLFLFDVTITNSQGAATKRFPLSINLSPAGCSSGAVRLGGSRIVNGSWSRGAFGGGMARAVPQAATGALPDLQINAASVSFTPSIPKLGDTVAVRFRVTNAGNADAARVPIALVVNGVTVASDTFDVRAGASTLAALEWTNARAPSGSRSLQASVVVDPNHTVAQKTTLAKSAPLAHFAFLPAWGGQPGSQLLTTTQRVTLEVADGGCVGFRFAAGAGSPCGSADVEITVEQLASGRFTLRAQNGIADLGPAFSGGKLVAAQYQPEVPAVAGHSYAVQLGGGKSGILRLLAIRNPAQANAKGRQVFGAGNVARNVGGQTTGPVETGDVSGVRTPSQSKAYFEVSYQTQ